MKHGIEKEEKQAKVKKSHVFSIILTIIIMINGLVSGVITSLVEKNIEGLGGGWSAIVATVQGQTPQTKKDLKRIDFLVIGESAKDGYYMSDTIMVCSYDPNEQTASILSIPRDTFVGTNKNRAGASTKINARYESGEKMDVLLSDIKNLLGLEIEHYIRVNTDALVELVNLTDGITFNVPIDMDYDDPTQDLHIHLKAGEQLITGEKAEQLLRFRHNNNGTSYSYKYGDNDYGRMRTQREFIVAAAKQLLAFENGKEGEKVNEIARIIETGSKSIKTNMDINSAIEYIPWLLDFDSENLKSAMLPGESELCNGAWIYVHDKTKTKEMVAEMFPEKIVEPSPSPTATSTNQ
jgi:LCP family protein required for cell wall assembly